MQKIAALISNEELLETELQKQGWAVFHPQRHSVSEQLDFLSDASRIAGTEGSAFHILVLFNSLQAKLDIISRSRGEINKNYWTIAEQKQFDQTAHNVDKEQVGEFLGNKTLYRFSSI